MKFQFLTLLTLSVITFGTTYASTKDVTINLEYIHCTNSNSEIVIPGKAISPLSEKSIFFYKYISCENFLAYLQSQSKGGKIRATLSMNEVLSNEQVNCSGDGCLSLDSVKLRSTEYKLEASYLGVLKTRGESKYAYGCHPYSNYKVCE